MVKLMMELGKLEPLEVFHATLDFTLGIQIISFVSNQVVGVSRVDALDCHRQLQQLKGQITA